MFSVLKARLLQGYRTGTFPDQVPVLPDHFKGAPHWEGAPEPDSFRKCAAVCPVNAVLPPADNGTAGLRIDLGKCIFCGKCTRACPALNFTKEYRLAAFEREQLIVDPAQEFMDRKQPDPLIRSLYGRSLKIRQVSAGGCNACELDFNVLNTLAWDMGRFGIQAVASPRHADAVLVTGPVTKNMLLALKKAHAAMPKPCSVIACGACAISGGLYADRDETLSGLEDVLKPDLYIPGCPPHPTTILDALLRFMK